MSWPETQHPVYFGRGLVSRLLFYLLFLSSLLSPNLSPVVSSSPIPFISAPLFSVFSDRNSTSFLLMLQTLAHTSFSGLPFTYSFPESLFRLLVLSSLLPLRPWIPEPVRAPASQSALTPGVRGEDAVAAALRTSPPCFQSCGGKWH